MTTTTKTDRVLNGVILPPVVDVCGNCRFGKLVALGVHECWGLPPTPVVMGARQNLAGQQEMAIELLRPRLASNTAGCALWREKLPGLAGTETRGMG